MNPHNNYVKKHNSLPMETVKLSNYSLSINPAQASGDIHRDYKACKKILKCFSHITSINITMFPEYSPTGRLHMHGVVIFRSFEGVFQFYEVLHQIKESCTYEFDTIEDVTKWRDYTLKQQHIMAPSLRKRDLKYKMKP